MIRASTRSGAAQRSRTRLVQSGISVNAVRTDRQFLVQVGPRAELGSVRCERSSSLQCCAMRRDAGVRGYQYPWLHWTRPDHVFVFYGGRDPLLCLSERALYAKTHRVQTNQHRRRRPRSRRSWRRREASERGELRLIKHQGQNQK